MASSFVLCNIINVVLIYFDTGLPNMSAFQTIYGRITPLRNCWTRWWSVSLPYKVKVCSNISFKGPSASLFHKPQLDHILSLSRLNPESRTKSLEEHAAQVVAIGDVRIFSFCYDRQDPNYASSLQLNVWNGVSKSASIVLMNLRIFGRKGTISKSW